MEKIERIVVLVLYYVLVGYMVYKSNVWWGLLGTLPMFMQGSNNSNRNDNE